jgi:phosphatidylglycerophosphatase A
MPNDEVKDMVGDELVQDVVSETIPAQPGDLLKMLIATACGLGFLRPAPGTWGSTPPCALAWLMLLAGLDVGWVTLAMAVTTLFGFFGSLFIGGYAERRFGKKDPSQVVIDEVGGQALTLLFLPAFAVTGFWHATLTIGAGFVLFRIMDILKPPPAFVLQRLKGGLGIVIDDLLAGLYAAVILQLALYGLRAAGVL